MGYVVLLSTNAFIFCINAVKPNSVLFASQTHIKIFVLMTASTGAKFLQIVARLNVLIIVGLKNIHHHLFSFLVEVFPFLVLLNIYSVFLLRFLLITGPKFSFPMIATEIDSRFLQQSTNIRTLFRAITRERRTFLS